MLEINPDNQILKYRCLFNGYPTIDETSSGCIVRSGTPRFRNSGIHIADDLYGRFFTGEYLNRIEAPYGVSRNLDYYDHGGNLNLPIIGEMRVPYRKIPIYKARNIQDINNGIKEIKAYSPSYRILLRGQNEVYKTCRPKGDLQFLYGTEDVIEPSFLPSYSRKSLDQKSICSAWHNLAAMLLTELKKKGIALPDSLIYTERFHLFALGIAQHYGLPSVGLDLTDNINVALWFALYRARYSSDTPVNAALIEPEHKDANIYVFRCPRLTIFSYDNLNVPLGCERPTRQNAYFNYCGWGLAKNQLALSLAAVFNVDSSFAESLPEDYISYLFPQKEEDLVLSLLLGIRERHQGSKFGRLLEGIYI